ncbi:type VII secretion target [Actinoplanes teichomyceticus]|uniref:Excreted virulence factor EspC (Type VII ESX diderm) n=1 Tax=Actinoplanes teichomyceticus TaxID=1867 RepID=A0A561WNR1_ACTTI|nr:type VII secretion target [Actinoplanes teichomyceticus]TWG25488.1 excreted virulence factor EspC (type VII ESX diderm) [Actinoplanes teichomyceticus]GIF10557.1 hypothetical protein Ate01nite_05890 [Actinoplanes teichomyceticus]
MSGEQLHVDTDRLRAAAQFQRQQALRSSELACRVRGAATVGDAFGRIGKSNGMEASYLDWVASEGAALDELTRMCNDLAEGLEHSAEQYDGVENHTADWMTSARGKLG